MKKICLLTLLFLIGQSCKNDDAPSCTKCNSPETIEFEVCRESNGNASVNGQDTGTEYSLYISDLEATGARCGI